jgi:hypothetical protein
MCDLSSLELSPGLPPSERVDVGVLSRIFDDTTNSYKFFFFLALLKRIIDSPKMPQNLNDSRTVIPLREIGIDMVMLAWYPRIFCRLSFGSQDKLQEDLLRVEWNQVRPSWIAIETDEWKRLRSECESKLRNIAALRYVPHLLLRPFFAQETRGIDNPKKLILELADQHFADRKPMYQFINNGNSIFLHHDWFSYLESNNQVLEGWCKFHLAVYLQQRNPGVAGILEKLVPPQVRKTLNSQRKYWNFILREKPELGRSIFSGAKIDPGSYALDHFVPWSFVAHDRLWNLVPEDSKTNSAKSDWLPSAKYILPLAKLQFEALQVAKTRPNLWKEFWPEFQSDLRLTEAMAGDFGDFESKLREAMVQNIEIASRQGFNTGWDYQMSAR